MTTPLPLDTRQTRIARRLLETVGPASVGDLATELKLTDRLVRYNLAGSERGVLEREVAAALETTSAAEIRARFTALLPA
jgi:hypothetical protein